MTFAGTHKSYENCDSYSFRQIEIKMDKPISLGFAILDFNKLPLYETYYDELQPLVGRENDHFHYINTDAFVLSMNTKDTIKDLKNLQDLFDFSNLHKKMNFSEKKPKSSR